MKKTNISDVYKLYSIFIKKNKENNNIYVKKYIGIPYIPTANLSILCKTFFVNDDKLIVTCKFNTYKNKWIPVMVADVQKIDIINNEKRIQIKEEYEESDEEDEDYNKTSNDF